MMPQIICTQCQTSPWHFNYIRRSSAKRSIQRRRRWWRCRTQILVRILKVKQDVQVHSGAGRESSIPPTRFDLSSFDLFRKRRGERKVLQQVEEPKTRLHLITRIPACDQVNAAAKQLQPQDRCTPFMTHPGKNPASRIPSTALQPARARQSLTKPIANMVAPQTDRSTCQCCCKVYNNTRTGGNGSKPPTAAESPKQDIARELEDDVRREKHKRYDAIPRSDIESELLLHAYDTRKTDVRAVDETECIKSA